MAKFVLAVEAFGLFVLFDIHRVKLYPSRAERITEDDTLSFGRERHVRALPGRQ